MRKLTDEEIEQTWRLIQEYYERYLSEQGVKRISLRKGSQYTKDALVLVYLAQGYPNTRWVSKEELTSFIRLYYPQTPDVQQARHLGPQKGYYVLSTRRGNHVGEFSEELRGESAYKLETLERSHPNYHPERRSVSGGDEFDFIKERYGRRCATCGSLEGERNFRYPNSITQLQKGHRNPRKPLQGDNIIPQCQFCNRADRNYWVYDERGRVVGVASAKVVIRSIEKGYINDEEAVRILEYLDRRLRRRQI